MKGKSKTCQGLKARALCVRETAATPVGRGRVRDMKKVEGNGRSSQKGSQGGAHWELKARVKSLNFKYHGNYGGREWCWREK